MCYKKGAYYATYSAAELNACEKNIFFYFISNLHIYNLHSGGFNFFHFEILHKNK